MKAKKEFVTEEMEMMEIRKALRKARREKKFKLKNKRRM